MSKSKNTKETPEKKLRGKFARLKYLQEHSQSCAQDIEDLSGGVEIAKVLKQKELSPPVSKSRMMTVLKILDYNIFNSYAKRHGLKKINRKTYQICLDDMSEKEKEKLRSL
jgi:hypothetical protein